MIRWTNGQIQRWARYYVDNTVTLVDMERDIDVPHSTLWWCFQHRLPKLDINLYDSVLERLDRNKRHPIHGKKGAEKK